MKRLCAEFIGTFVLVLFGCGTAILAGKAAGIVGIALAFGLSVLVMAYAVGYISGGHFNPAVTLGAWAAKRIEREWVAPYIAVQCLGAVVAAAVIYCIAKGAAYPADGVNAFAANVVTNYSMCAAFATEAVLTFVFLYVILGTTAKEAASHHAPIAIGFALTAIHLVSIPVTNTSVNPARSLSQAMFSVDPLAVHQLWLFWVAPIVGAVLAGLIYRYMETAKVKAVPVKTVSKKKK